MARTTSTSARNASPVRSRRGAGLRAITVWVPDLRNLAYRERLTAACNELAALPATEAEADTTAGLAGAFKHVPGWR
jgi:hypothetical protein